MESTPQISTFSPTVWWVLELIWIYLFITEHHNVYGSMNNSLVIELRIGILLWKLTYCFGQYVYRQIIRILANFLKDCLLKTVHYNINHQLWICFVFCPISNHAIQSFCKHLWCHLILQLCFAHKGPLQDKIRVKYYYTTCSGCAILTTYENYYDFGFIPREDGG